MFFSQDQGHFELGYVDVCRFKNEFGSKVRIIFHSGVKSI